MKSYTRFIWINMCCRLEFTLLTAAGSMEKAADASVCSTIYSTDSRLSCRVDFLRCLAVCEYLGGCERSHQSPTGQSSGLIQGRPVSGRHSGTVRKLEMQGQTHTCRLIFVRAHTHTHTHTSCGMSWTLRGTWMSPQWLLTLTSSLLL